jgi:hypothetical protein
MYGWVLDVNIVQPEFMGTLRSDCVPAISGNKKRLLREEQPFLYKAI